MDHSEHLKQGDLHAALESIQNQIRSDPSNAPSRIFLFQLLSIMGQWQRALKQLEVIKKLDDKALPMVQMYQSAIQCETLREQVFLGKKEPILFGEPEQWQALLIHALKLTAENKHTDSQNIRSEAFDVAPTTSGLIDDNRFTWIADADSRIGPMLEVFVNGKYLWAPFSHIKKIQIEQAEDLRDLAWLPAQIQWQTEGETPALIPTRYPSSEKQNDLLALSRKTEWQTVDTNMHIAYGQRMFVTDQDEYPLLNVRSIIFTD